MSMTMSERVCVDMDMGVGVGQRRPRAQEQCHVQSIGWSEEIDGGRWMCGACTHEMQVQMQVQVRMAMAVHVVINGCMLRCSSPQLHGPCVTKDAHGCAFGPAVHGLTVGLP